MIKNKELLSSIIINYCINIFPQVFGDMKHIKQSYYQNSSHEMKHFRKAMQKNKTFIGIGRMYIYNSILLYTHVKENDERKTVRNIYQPNIFIDNKWTKHLSELE